MPPIHCSTKRRHFKHLSLSQRGQIQALLESGIPKTQIAKRLGISRSTLYKVLEPYLLYVNCIEFFSSLDYLWGKFESSAYIEKSEHKK